KLRTRSWQDKDGNTRYTTEIVAENMQMIGRKDENTSSTPSDTSAPSTPEIEQNNSMEDDLPF
ncbi:MAG TPA: single-stranded DNA-binding protein, partial [Vicingus sp.]|nr:single-stranded DNA-binding protein [Vicingus sp.]